MILRRLIAMLSSQNPSPSTPGRLRLQAPEMPAVVYAVGDIHGRMDLLADLESRILAHGKNHEGEKWIVMLGDYIDRGPQSSQVLNHLQTSLPDKWRRICLAGNHEDAMLSALRDKEACLRWLAIGGYQTLTSYGISASQIALAERDWKSFGYVLQSHVAESHIKFLEELPVAIELPDHILVHGGMQPGFSLSQQTERDLLWLRHNEKAVFDKIIVHGHTIVDDVLVSPTAINVDTGAYFSGCLSAVALRAGAPATILRTPARAFASNFAM